jgi:tRNA(Arg) A34 adenosine deaminase TadA
MIQMNDEEIRVSGIKELEKIGFKNKRVRIWKTTLLDYEFDYEYQDDKYIWFANILALKAIDHGNFGVGCILIDVNSNIIVQGHNEVFNPYFRSDRHAEMVVMDKFENTHRGINKRENYTLYTSLEPCPMCLIRLITSDINTVLYAASDITGGMVHKMQNVPPLWIELYEGKVFSQANCSQELISAANDIFLINSNELLEKIKHRSD